MNKKKLDFSLKLHKKKVYVFQINDKRNAPEVAKIIIIVIDFLIQETKIIPNYCTSYFIT